MISTKSYYLQDIIYNQFQRQTLNQRVRQARSLGDAVGNQMVVIIANWKLRAFGDGQQFANRYKTINKDVKLSRP